MTGPDRAALEAAIDAYVAAWNEPDDDARASLLDRAVSDGCSFAGPLGTTVGRDAIASQIVEARDFLPGAAVERSGRAEDVDGELRFGWRITGPGGAALADGFDVVEVAADGRLAAIRVLPSRPSA